MDGETMKLIFVRLAMALFSICAIMALFGGKAETRPASLPVTAAFRDGVYLGRRDAQSGNKPSPVKSRWSSEEDRRSFAAGYYRGYMIEGLPASQVRWIPKAIDNKGFEDGKADGLADRANHREFNLASKANFRNPAGRCDASNPDANTCTQQYRDAYVTGYQHGYYGVDAKTARRVRRLVELPQNV